MAPTSVTAPQRRNTGEKTSRARGGESYPTVINNQPVESIRDWAYDLIDKYTRARDYAVAGSVRAATERHKSRYPERVKRNYDYYHDLRTRLMEEFQSSENTPCANHLQKEMRTKFSMIADANACWTFETDEDTDRDFVLGLNQITRQKLIEEEYRQANLDLKAQTITFGTAVMTYLHSMAIEQPDGARVFEAIDPLGFLVEFGSRYINGRGTYRSKALIIVRMRNVDEIEMDWGKEIITKDGDRQVGNYINPKDYSIRHAVGRESDNLTDRIPEVMIWHWDTTTKAIIKQVPKLSKLLNPMTNEVEIDRDGNEILEQEHDPKTGEPLFKNENSGQRAMLYPSGRLIVIAGGTIAYDGRNFYKHRMTPAVVLRNTWDGVDFWGIGDPDIAADNMQAVYDIDRRVFASMKARSGVLLINQAKMVDPHQDINWDNGPPTIRVKVPGGGDIKGVSYWDQPTGYSAEEMRYREVKIAEIGELLGTSPVSGGKAFAADSGAKVTQLDAMTMRFQAPLMMGEEINMRDLGIMFLCNLSQFETWDKLYTYVGKDGRPKSAVWQKGMAELERDFPIKTTRGTLLGSSYAEMFAVMIQLKQILGDNFPDRILLKFINDPELQEIAAQDAETQARLKEVLAIVEASGMLPMLMEAAKARTALQGQGAGNTTSPQVAG